MNREDILLRLLRIVLLIELVALVAVGLRRQTPRAVGRAEPRWCHNSEALLQIKLHVLASAPSAIIPPRHSLAFPAP